MKAYVTLSFALLLCSAAPAQAAPLGTRTVLDNGATLLVAERPGIPMVVMTILLKTGAAADPDGKAGLANLTAVLLTRGTKKHSAQALAEELDFLGASLAVDADYETTTISLTTLTKNLEPALGLLSEVLISPTFPEPELERKRKEIKGGLRSREEEPGWVAHKAFVEKLYPHHPFGRLVEGQPTTLDTLTQAEVKSSTRRTTALTTPSLPWPEKSRKSKRSTCCAPNSRAGSLQISRAWSGPIPSSHQPNGSPSIRR